jgi:hypothetical protein
MWCMGLRRRYIRLVSLPLPTLQAETHWS